MRDPTQRFSSRVENYIKYRPTYPAEVLDHLAEECGLAPAAVVADIGSGTGLLAELFLRRGNQVLGVEPNQEMRVAGERLLAHYPRFISIAGRAEATTLPPASVDFITAGQAFHWFEPEGTRHEWLRILRPGGWVVLIWNQRRVGATPFLDAYEQFLLRNAPEYEASVHRESDQAGLYLLFGSRGFQRRSFANRQEFDYPAFEGRVLSSSYVPDADDPRYAPMLAELRELFEAHQEAGKVYFDYDTQVYYGQLS